MVTDHDRVIADMLLDPAIAEDFELVPTAINGVECAVLSHMTFCDRHGLTMRPVAVIMRPELFEHLRAPEGVARIEE